jgi:hypothetical protein
MTDEVYVCSISIGFLWYGQLRAELEELKEEYDGFSYREGKGWLHPYA